MMQWAIICSWWGGGYSCSPSAGRFCVINLRIFIEEVVTKIFWWMSMHYGPAWRFFDTLSRSVTHSVTIFLPIVFVPRKIMLQTSHLSGRKNKLTKNYQIFHSSKGIVSVSSEILWRILRNKKLTSYWMKHFLRVKLAFATDV